MTSPGRILVAFDFFETSRCAIHQARYLAEHFESTIIPVHAVEYLPYHYGLNYWNKIHNELSPRIAEAFKAMTTAGIKVETPVIREGRPFFVVLSAADDTNADMIVIGCRKAGLKDRILGTTPSKLVRVARQPVLVVDCTQTDVTIKRILCAVDLSVASMTVMETAISVAARLKAELAVLHVAPGQMHYPGLEDMTIPVVELRHGQASGEVGIDKGESERDETVRDQVFRDYLEKFDLSGITCRQILRQGTPVDEIISEAADNNHDLLIMGTYGRPTDDRVRISDVTEKVLRRMPCSVLTVKNRIVAPLAASRVEQTTMDVVADAAQTEIERLYAEGTAALVAGCPDDAIRAFKTCIERDDRFFPALDGLAQSYDRKGDSQTATMWREQATSQRLAVFRLLNARG